MKVLYCAASHLPARYRASIEHCLSDIFGELNIDTSAETGYYWILAFDKRYLVGVAALTTQDHLLTFGVRPGYRRRGIGTELLERMRQITPHSVSVVVPDQRPARSFFSRFGTETRPGGFTIP